jgi:hypothetical protein
MVPSPPTATIRSASWQAAFDIATVSSLLRGASRHFPGKLSINLVRKDRRLVQRLLAAAGLMIQTIFYQADFYFHYLSIRTSFYFVWTA